MAPRSEEVPKSSLGIATPSRRDGLTQTVDMWLEDKTEVDGAEGLWRVHDGLYDLNDFIATHPGGPDWLTLTKGTDVTEAFEVHHLSTYPEELLKKFYVRDAKTKRNGPFTFKEDGFYRTLKRDIRDVMKNVPKQPSNTTNFMIDALLLGTFVFSILAAAYWNHLLGIIAGMFLAMTTIAAHNYFHRKDNFRMYYFQLSLMNVSWEPFLQYMPIEKKPIVRFGSWFYAPLYWITGFHSNMVRRFVLFAKGDLNQFKASDAVPLILPLVMYIFGGQGIFATLYMWTFIILAGSTHFFFVGLHAAHHHPDIFHDGDAPRAVEDYDWGLSQLDAIMDRKEISGSHFLVLTNFGDHALHHLFPTLDHGTLEHLYPTFEKVLEQFNANLRMVSQLDTLVGGFQQLCRVKPNPNPPDLHKKY